ncbi:MAG: addiction module protein [Verrucomicrobia bacterium]|nr:addiction module protein [Verrucomicrobiota bacterium]
MAVTPQTYQRLEEEVLHLPRVDRSQLACRLLESPDEDEHELTPEWCEELQRRASAIDAGKAILMPSAALWNEINQHLGTIFWATRDLGTVKK